MPANKNSTYPYKPIRPVAPNPLKKGVITRKLNGKMYDIMVRTTTDQVYDKNKKSVTERLAEADQGIADNSEKISALEAEPNMVFTESDEIPENVKDGDIYCKITSKDNYPENTEETSDENSGENSGEISGNTIIEHIDDDDSTETVNDGE